MDCVVPIHSGFVVNCKKLIIVMTLLHIDLAVATENTLNKLVNNAINFIPRKYSDFSAL